VIKIKAKESLSIEAAEEIILNRAPFELDGESLMQVEESLNFLLDFSLNKIIYGINTGFGPMAQYKIDENKQVELQYNLIRSHSAGAGEKIPDPYVKASLLVRMLSIMQGKSGITSHLSYPFKGILCFVFIGPVVYNHMVAIFSELNRNCFTNSP